MTLYKFVFSSLFYCNPILTLSLLFQVPVFALDGTDVTEWDSRVRDKAFSIVQSKLDNTPCPVEPQPFTVHITDQKVSEWQTVSVRSRELQWNSYHFKHRLGLFPKTWGRICKEGRKTILMCASWDFRGATGSWPPSWRECQSSGNPLTGLPLVLLFLIIPKLSYFFDLVLLFYLKSPSGKVKKKLKSVREMSVQ